MIKYDLTKAEKHCLIQIDQIGYNIVNMSIYDIMEITNCSSATLNRLIKKMGYRNFKHYKSQMIERQQNNNDDSFTQKMVQMYDSYYPYEYNVIKDKVNQANIIHVIGKGISRGAVNELSFALDDLGYNVIRHEKCEMLLSNSLRVIKENDLVIFVSYSGKDREMIEVAKSLEHHVFRVLLTLAHGNELSNAVDLIIQSGINEYDSSVKLNIPLSIIVHKIIIAINE